MSRVEVAPGQLRTAAASCLRGAETADGARRGVLAAGSADTGRPATSAAVDELVRELGTALAGLAAALHGDAQALRGAADGYTAVDGQGGRR